MKKEEILLDNLYQIIARERKIVNELNFLYNSFDKGTVQEKKLITSQIESLKSSLESLGTKSLETLEKVSLFKKIPKQKEVPAEEEIDVNVQNLQNQVQNIAPAVQGTPLQANKVELGKRRFKLEPLEKLTIKRAKRRKIKKGEGKKKEKKPSKYLKLSSKYFFKYSTKLINKGSFHTLRRDLVRSNMEVVPASYISMIFLTTILSVIVAVLVTLFFLFFNLSALPPFISMTEQAFGIRFLQVFWLLIVVPATTFLFVYFYPSLERQSLESRINQELPFATIHMASISNSMIEPSNIFNIIISTKEYPFLEKEFTKLQNEINVYGYDLVTALRNRAFNSPSRKLSDLFNGLATSITSGGDLPGFFDKRSQSLLFEHRLDKERQSKAAETFMDIYISVVIAAPMILMLLLIMMRISGLGVSLGTNTITIVMVLGVSLVNILFLTFLHLKQPTS